MVGMVEMVEMVEMVGMGRWSEKGGRPARFARARGRIIAQPEPFVNRKIAHFQKIDKNI